MVRNEKIDIVKAICIILMVVCHTDFEHYLVFRRVVHLFHMPVFLMAAGWFFSSVKVETMEKYRTYVIGKIRRIWVPYVLTTFLAMALIPLLEQMVGREPLTNYVRECVKAVCLCSGLRERGQLWFLSTLFWVYVFYGGLEFCLAKSKIKSLIPQTVLAVAFCLFGKYAHARLLACIGGPQVFVCYALFHLGVLCRRYTIKIQDEGAIKNLIIASSLMLFLMGMGLFDHLGLAQNQYYSGLTVPIVAVAGWLMCYSLAILICAVPVVGRTVAYIGKHTMPILLFHMLLFQFVGWTLFQFGLHPAHELGHVPTCFTGLPYVFIYSIVGVVVPLLLNALWEMVASLVHERLDVRL